MKILKKVLKITGITLLVLILLAFTVPVVFKTQITRLVKKEINKSINARVDFDDVSLSLFRRFPKVSISINDLSVTGIDHFEHDTLLSASRVEASANLFSVIKGKDIKVFGVFLESPRIHALVTKDGQANWDIAKDDTASTADANSSASAFRMSLKKYAIQDGYIEYSDESSDTYFEINGLAHEGSGDFTQDVFTLQTKTNASTASFTQAAIPYLVNTETGIETDIEIDNRTNTYTFKTDDISLNKLMLTASGFIRLVNDSTYDMDIKFNSPTNSFKDILSLVPAVYKQDFDKIKTSGNAVFNGFVKGRYSPVQMPAYDIVLAIKDGFFQYPDLPKPVKNIQLDLHASNPDGKPDNAIIDISKGHLEMDNEGFDFRFLFKQPETAQYIDAAAKGKINLSQLSQFIKLDKGTQLSGFVLADAFIKGNMSAIQNQQGPFWAGGFFDVTNLSYSSPSFPQPLRNGNMKIQLENSGGIADNTALNIPVGHIEVGNDPLDFSLRVTKPVSTANFEGAARGRFTLNNVKQFATLEPGTELSGLLHADLKFAGNKPLIDKGEYDKIQLSGDTRLENVKYISSDYPSGIVLSNTAISFNPSVANITGFAGRYLGSNFNGNGTLNNLVGFALRNDPLKGSVNLAVDRMNLNDWIGTEESAPSASTTTSSSSGSKPFLVPANLDISLHAKAGQVTYDKVNYNNVNGTLLLSDETVKLQDVKTDVLEGTVLMNGSYSTKNNKTNPEMGLSYNIKDMDVQKAFLSFNTIKALMPIAQFLDGKLNSELTMTGSLDGNMMPDLNSLSGKGNLLLIEGVLKKFAPLEKLASTLQIDRLKSVSVKDIKNYIEFANGKVLVKPFTLKVDDIEMQIGGMHGFDQAIDYIIGMKVPRKYLGTEGNKLVNGLAAQAASKGIPMQLGEMVDLHVKMGGTITNPSITIDLEKVAGDAVNELKEQAKDFAEQKIDSAKSRVKDTLAVIKEKAKEDLKERIKDQVFGTKDTNQAPQGDTAKKKITPAIKNKLKDIFNRQKNPSVDTTRQ